MNIDWACPFTIESDYGDLDLNQTDAQGRKFRINPKKSVARRGVRANNDNVPQDDGEIFHRRFATGSEMELVIQLWLGDNECACDDHLVEMYDQIRGVAWGLLNPVDDGGRVRWTPSGQSERMMIAARLAALSDPEEDEKGCTEIRLTIDTPFPYAISAAENVVAMSGTVTLPNAGNAVFYPVFKVDGATGAWAITDNETGKIYLYDASRPGGQAIGGGDYAEIDMFRGGLIYLNGDQDNLKPNIDVEASDVLTVQPGGSSYTITGATGVALMHDAWA